MLDVSIRAEILNLLADLRREKGISVIFITHDMATAANICDRIAVMYLGRIVELGPTREVLAHPHHPYTKALISVIPIPNPRHRRKRIILQGAPPNAMEIPTGCRFHPRCPMVFERCEKDDPGLMTVRGEHLSACWLMRKNHSEQILISGRCEMQNKISLSEKFEYNGWPSMPRPDAKPPEGWSYPLLSSQERVFNPSVSPDGRWVAFIWHRDAACEVYVISSEGGFPQRISYGRKAFQYWWEEIPQWSPDGRSLAFCIDHHAYTADLEGGLPRKVSGFAESASAPRWMQDSEHLVITVERDGLDQLLLTDREGTWPRLLAANKGDNGDARPSPDGKFVIYTHRPLADLNREDICIADLQNGGGGIISGMPGRRCWNPRISPDGKRIIYLSNRTKFHELWLFQLDTASDEQLTHAGADLADPVWSPDGRWIAATINNGGMNDLVLVDPASGAIKELRRPAGGTRSPDGVRIADR